TRPKAGGGGPGGVGAAGGKRGGSHAGGGGTGVSFRSRPWAGGAAPGPPMTAPLVVLFLLGQAGTTPLPSEHEPVRYRGEKATSDGQGNVLHLEAKADLPTDTTPLPAPR